MEVNYFWDSYAVIEFENGNPSYQIFSGTKVSFTIFNLGEIYWNFLNNLEEKETNDLYEYYKDSVVEISDEVLKEAIKFRKVNKKKDLSYADCIGYIYALKNGMKFLTGDKEFQGLKNVEFVR